MVLLWEFIVKQSLEEKNLRTHQRVDGVINKFGGIENIRGLCARCGQRVEVRIDDRIFRPEFAEFDEKNLSDSYLFELKQHDYQPGRTCYASSAKPHRLVANER